MMQSDAAPEPPPEPPAGAEASAPVHDAAPLPQFEREEEAPPQGWSRVRRVRELYVGPMSWVMAFCVLGPLVFLCPCDGRDVWMGDCCGEGCVLEAHEDDEYDQDGTQLRPLKRDPSRPGGRIITDDSSWPPSALATGVPDGGSALARQRSLGVTA